MAKEYWITINDSLHNIGDVVEAEQIKYYGMGVDSQADLVANLQAENKRLRDALAFYADGKNYLGYYTNDDPGDPLHTTSDVAEDSGERARKALEGGE